jgi:preprotein translocase subunit SecB
MAENTTPEQGNPQFALQRIYTKDISFETPNSPAIFTDKWEPKVNVDINSASRMLQEGLFEVVLTVTVTTRLGDKTAYLAEVKQAGVFAFSGFNEQDMGGMLNSYCPNMLFPFAREVISDLVTKGSFPQMLLSPINFDALYAQHLQQQAGKQADQEPATQPVH